MHLCNGGGGGKCNMTYDEWILNSKELYHHGILGMKRGVRRYQNKDGSLTAAGRKRYLKGYLNEGGEDPADLVRNTPRFRSDVRDLKKVYKNAPKVYRRAKDSIDKERYKLFSRNTDIFKRIKENMENDPDETFKLTDAHPIDQKVAFSYYIAKMSESRQTCPKTHKALGELNSFYARGRTAVLAMTIGALKENASVTFQEMFPDEAVGPFANVTMGDAYSRILMDEMEDAFGIPIN